MISGGKNASVSSLLLFHEGLVTALFGRARFRKISVCAGIRLLSASMNELPQMKNMTRRGWETQDALHMSPQLRVFPHGKTPDASARSEARAALLNLLWWAKPQHPLSKHWCGLDNVFTTGGRRSDRPSLILILALLDRLGQNRIIR